MSPNSSNSDWSLELTQGSQHPLCLFSNAAEELFGIPVEQVKEVLPPRSHTPLAHAPNWIPCLFALRGRCCMIVDFDVLCGEEPAIDGRFILLRPKTDEWVALRVRRVHEVSRRARLTNLYSRKVEVKGVVGAELPGLRGDFIDHNHVGRLLDPDTLLEDLAYVSTRIHSFH